MTKPHPEGVRFHCTMVRHLPSSGSNPGGNNGNHQESSSGSSAAEDGSAEDGATYTLYLEHLGGFLPLLKGRKVSKIRPDFVIYDPSLNGDITNKLFFPIPFKY